MVPLSVDRCVRAVHPRFPAAAHRGHMIVDPPVRVAYHPWEEVVAAREQEVAAVLAGLARTAATMIIRARKILAGQGRPLLVLRHLLPVLLQPILILEMGVLALYSWRIQALRLLGDSQQQVASPVLCLHYLMRQEEPASLVAQCCYLLVGVGSLLAALLAGESVLWLWESESAAIYFISISLAVSPLRRLLQKLTLLAPARRGNERVLAKRIEVP